MRKIKLWRNDEIGTGPPEAGVYSDMNGRRNGVYVKGMAEIGWQ